tara:strand:+ start:283 stop:453 length:171 start_codon:yes stop_codon:yes gene_type:complete
MGQALSIEDFEDFRGIGRNNLNKSEYEIIKRIYTFTYIFTIVSFLFLFLFFYKFNI